MTGVQATPSITDEAIAALREWLGRPRPARGWNSSVTADAVWHFAAGVGDDNPLWWDQGYAERTRHGRMFAPPTFLYSCNNAPEQPGEHRIHPSENWLSGSRTMWLGDKWTFLRPTWVGEPVTAVETLIDVQERTSRSGKRVVVHTDRTTFTGGDGTRIAYCDKTVLRAERGSGASGAGSEPGAGPSGESSDSAEPVYSAADLDLFAAHYNGEAGNRRGGTRLEGAAVAPGDSLGSLLKGPLTRTAVVGWVLGWGSPMCLTSRMQHGYLASHPGSRLVNERTNIPDSLEATHWDTELARQAGLPRAYDFGPQRISWVAHLLTDWMGDDAFLASLEARLTGPNLLGDVTWLSGEVRGTERLADGTWAIDCAVTGRNQRGQQTTEATARVLAP